MRLYNLPNSIKSTYFPSQWNDSFEMGWSESSYNVCVQQENNIHRIKSKVHSFMTHLELWKTEGKEHTMRQAHKQFFISLRKFDSIQNWKPGFLFTLWILLSLLSTVCVSKIKRKEIEWESTTFSKFLSFDINIKRWISCWTNSQVWEFHSGINQQILQSAVA